MRSERNKERYNMLLYRLIHHDWEDYWWYKLLKKDPEKYFQIEDKYVYALIKIIESSGYKTLNVRGLINYELMNYERDCYNDVIFPVNTDLKKLAIRRSKRYYKKFPDRYPESMRQLHNSIRDGMELNINQIADALRLHSRDHIGFMLHSEFKYVIDTPTEYYYVMCENPIEDSLIKHINEMGMIFEICNDCKYNEIYPLIEEHYDEGQIHFLTNPMDK